MAYEDPFYSSTTEVVPAEDEVPPEAGESRANPRLILISGAVASMVAGLILGAWIGGRSSRN